MTSKYVSKDAWHFQYIVDSDKPFYNALVNYQGADSSDTPIVEEDAEGGREGEYKTIFPGGNITNEEPIY